MLPLELPEIETIRRDLERETAGRKIKSVDVKSLKSLGAHSAKKTFTDPLDGVKVVVVERQAMTVIIRLENGHSIVIKLGDGGRVERIASKEPAGDDLQVAITFTQGGDLRLCDSEGNSTFSVVADDALEEFLAEPEPIGLDLQAEPLSWLDFGRYVLSRHLPLKLLITDPTIFIGIGDIYSNEILFDAGLRHDRMSDELSTQEIRRLYRSVAGIIHDAIKYGGTSLEDRPFNDVNGKPGEYAEHLAVWGKAGELSPRSRLPIQKTSFKHQVVFFCSTQV